MEKIICTISLGKNQLDNDYTFFEDGRILHSYDQSSFKLNIERWLKPNDIGKEIKQLLIAKCPLPNKQEISNILNTI